MGGSAKAEIITARHPRRSGGERSGADPMTGVLDGVVVLDLSQGISGPIVGMLFGDHGAQVSKTSCTHSFAGSV